MSDAPETVAPVAAPAARTFCGIIMPISPTEGYRPNHWDDVLTVITEALGTAGFDGELVSAGSDVAIIQKRIIQNLYENEIVVCDVSSRNPNVMFELGMRLAFNKPVVVIKDDKTVYPFDTSPIEYVPYPSDLRYTEMGEFKRQLGEKVKATHSKTSGAYTPFLDAYGQFTVAKLDQKEVSFEQKMLEEMSSLRRSVQALEQGNATRKAVSLAELLAIGDTTLGKAPTNYVPMGLLGNLGDTNQIRSTTSAMLKESTTPKKKVPEKE